MADEESPADGICPKCKASLRKGTRFDYLDPIIRVRPLLTTAGAIEITFSHDEYDDSSRKAKLGCRDCDHTFPVPKDFFDWADWG
jgi:hypothetical protein